MNSSLVSRLLIVFLIFPYIGCVSSDFDPLTERIVLSDDKRELFAERGKKLVENVAVCSSCHGSDLSGGKKYEDQFGEVDAANITSSKTSGIGQWSVLDLVRAIRASIDRNGRPLSLESHQNYRWLSDKDAQSIAVYLLSTKPLEKTIERRELGSIERNKWFLISQHSDIAGYVPDYRPIVAPSYGRYLTQHVANCMRCHNSNSLDSNHPAPDIQGGKGKRLENWSKDDYVRYLSGGVTPAGELRSDKDCPWPNYKGMEDLQKTSIALYLKSLS